MRTRITHKQHIKYNKHTSHHRYYTCFFNNGGHPKGKVWMTKGHRIFEPGEIKIFLKNKKTKTMGVRNNSSNEAIKERRQQDKEEEIVKINESRDDKIVL
jgi:hypothetical protein